MPTSLHLSSSGTGNITAVSILVVVVLLALLILPRVLGKSNKGKSAEQSWKPGKDSSTSKPKDDTH